MVQSFANSIGKYYNNICFVRPFYLYHCTFFKLKSTLIIAFVLTCTLRLAAQDFGCFEVNNSSANHISNYTVLSFSNNTDFKDINWKEFDFDSIPADGEFCDNAYHSNSCKPFTRMKGQVKNGKKEGNWVLYLDNNSLVSGKFISDKKEGVWKGFRIMGSDTVLAYSSTFRNNLLNGLEVDYHSSGTKNYLCNYKDGLKHGVNERFNEDGELVYSCQYLNGLKHGKEIEREFIDTSKGYIVRELTHFKTGKKNGFTYRIHRKHPNDTSYEGNYNNDLRNGRFVFNESDKRIECNYLNNELDGTFKMIYPNGIVGEEIVFKNNFPYNHVASKDTNGNILAVKTLVNGTGTLSSFYPDGKLKSTYTYKNQLLNGHFIRHFQSGAVAEQGVLYSNGTKTYKSASSIERLRDINFQTSWNQNFIAPTKFQIFNPDSTLKRNIYCQNNLVEVETYRKGRLYAYQTDSLGLLQGKNISFYDSGDTSSVEYLKIIKRDSTLISVQHGTFRYFHKNASIQAVVNYHFGKEIGVSRFYDEADNLVRQKVNLKNGSVYNVFNGDTVNRMDSLGRKQGKWITLPMKWSNTECTISPQDIQYFKDGKPVGTWLLYSFDGTKLIETREWLSEYECISTKWNHNRKFKFKGYLVNNRRQGKWKVYDLKKGYLKFQQHYDCNQPTGIWLEFKKNGKVKKREDKTDQ